MNMKIVFATFFAVIAICFGNYGYSGGFYGDPVADEKEHQKYADTLKKQEQEKVIKMQEQEERGQADLLKKQQRDIVIQEEEVLEKKALHEVQEHERMRVMEEEEKQQHGKEPLKEKILGIYEEGTEKPLPKTKSLGQ